MSDFSTMHRAEAYLAVHLTHAGPAGTARTDGPFVTISRESGTAGSTLAQALLESLAREKTERPWAVYSGNLIEEMLRTNDLPPHLARFLPEDRIPEFDASVGEFVGLHPNLWALVAKTNELIRQLARAGHAIILGRGAAFATAGIRHGVHVRLVASEQHRAACTARWLALSPENALMHNAARNGARRRYVRATFNADIADPTAYDLVLNAERLSLETMAQFIAQLVEQAQAARTAAGSHPEFSATTFIQSG